MRILLDEYVHPLQHQVQADPQCLIYLLERLRIDHPKPLDKALAVHGANLIEKHNGRHR
jgi:hypothetical protein